MTNRILAAILALVAIAGCGKIRDIRVTSCELASFSVSGLRSADGVISVGIDNPASGFEVSGIEGKVYRNGEELADFTADPFEVAKKSEGTYSISGRATLAQGVSVLSLMSLIGNFSPEDCTVDISARIKAKGISRTVSRTGIPLGELIK